MAAMYLIKGFSEYYFKEKVLFRKSYKTKSKTCKWQYRAEREIKQTFNNKTAGYLLVKNKKRKFYSLNYLRNKLKKVIS